MQAMREAGMFCDATVIVEGITFPVHRVVSAAGSEVLAAMFAAGFLEGQKLTAELPEVRTLPASSLLRAGAAGKFAP